MIPISLAVLIVLTYSIVLLNRAAIDTLIQEDGVFESFGAAGLLAAAVFFFVGFLRSRRGASEGAGRRLKPAAFLMLALLFVVGAGEEVSWGQRIFGWGTPKGLKPANAQGETTLHNLKPVNETLVSAPRLFTLFWLGFAVALPLAVAVSGRARRFLEARLPIVPLALVPLFVFNQVVSETVEAAFPGSLYHGEQLALGYPLADVMTETREMNFAILFAVAAFMIAAGLTAAGQPRKTGPEARLGAGRTVKGPRLRIAGSSRIAR